MFSHAFKVVDRDQLEFPRNLMLSYHIIHQYQVYATDYYEPQNFVEWNEEYCNQEYVSFTHLSGHIDPDYYFVAEGTKQTVPRVFLLTAIALVEVMSNKVM